MKPQVLAALAWISFSCLTSSRGQEPGSIAPTSAAPFAARDGSANAGIDLGEFFPTPIRARDTDQGVGGGTWTAGGDFKASFDEGFCFEPVLGTAYERNLPWAWRTVEVSCGGEALLAPDEAPHHSVSDARYEYRFAHFVEAYDVRIDGVEQTFVFAERPSRGGALVVRGRVATDLRAATRGAEVGALVFRGMREEAVVTYGAARAIDALGGATSVTAAWDGETLELVIPEAWLADATFPVTLDPLISNGIIASDPQRRAAYELTVARDDVANDLLIVYGRANSASDYDLFALMTESDFSNPTIVHDDLSSTWSTRSGDVAFIGGSSRWLIVMQRDFGNGSFLRGHTLASGDRTYRTDWFVVAGSNGNSMTHPQVGGTVAFSTGTGGLVVYQFDLGLANTSASEVFGVLVDATAQTVGTPFLLEPGASLDRETPSINPESDGGSTSWIVCWTQLDNTIANDDWDLRIARIAPTGTERGRSVLGNTASSVHAFLPRVAGRGGRYLVSYGEEPNAAGSQANGLADKIWAQRFDWSEAAPGGPTPLARTEVLGTSQFDQRWNGDVAFDSNTTCHWAVTAHSQLGVTTVHRMGYDAGICEFALLSSIVQGGQAAWPSVVFDDDANRFAIAYTRLNSSSTTSPQPIVGALFAYPTFLLPSAYGTGCGPATLGSNANSHGLKPHSGQERFEIRISNAPANAPGLLVMGVNPIDLPIPGFPGCHLHVGTPFVYLPLNASGSGAALPTPIPSGIAGDVFLEWWYLSPAAPGGLQITRGLKVEVR